MGTITTSSAHDKTNRLKHYSRSLGTGSMHTLGIWTFIILAGWSSALQGPPKVTGTLGESLTVQCHYEKEYRRNDKYWCRRKWTSLCSAIVKSTRDEPSMRNSRTSITDDRANHLIRVTIGELTEDDAGDYSCAVSVTGLDPSFTVRVTVLKGTTTIKTTKGTVTNSTQSFTARTAEITTSPTWRPFVQMTSVPPGPTPRATATTSATSTNSFHTGPRPAASLALILAPPPLWPCCCYWQDWQLPAPSAPREREEKLPFPVPVGVPRGVLRRIRRTPGGLLRHDSL